MVMSIDSLKHFQQDTKFINTVRHNMWMTDFLQIKIFLKGFANSFSHVQGINLQ